MIENVFTWVGVLASLYILLNYLLKFYHACRVYVFPTYPNFSKYGKWSVVTGAADGIGKEIALQLAARGQNIIAIDRNLENLEKLSQQTKNKYGVQTKYLQIDFTNEEAIFEKIEAFLYGLDIGVLVNNVGIISPEAKFLDIPDLSTFIRNISRINMFTLFKMHQIVLPGMVQRKRGLIINMSSACALRPIPRLACYGATKAFVAYFSQSISYEYADQGINIQTCMPLGIQTNMTKHFKHSHYLPLPKNYVSWLLTTSDKERITHGSWPQSFQAFFWKKMPLKWLHAFIKNNGGRISVDSNNKIKIR